MKMKKKMMRRMRRMNVRMNEICLSGIEKMLPGV